MGEFLSNLSEALAGIVATAGQGVARVEARRRLPASGLIWSSDGMIVSAHHVVQQEEAIKVGLPDGKTVGAMLIGRDPTTDVAVLRAEASSLEPATFATPDDLQVGHLVLALGRPGKTVQATMGIVSALGATWRTPAGGQVDTYLQTDAVMYPGFSGGLLVDMQGQARGMNTSALLRGISLAVPLPTLRSVVDALLAHGRVRRGYLGVGTQAVRLPKPVSERLNQETGMLVMSVSPASPADEAGLLLGDTIVNLDNQRVRHMEDLQLLLSSERVGVAVPVGIVRSGQVQELKVTVGERS
jgi:S1-C subfamily serine protease